MSKSIRTKDKSMQVELFDEGRAEIESPVYDKIGIEVEKINPFADETAPKGALYKIDVYLPGKGGALNARPSEYDVAWVLTDGTILHRKNRRGIGSP
jgi:hypothetical protein